MKRTAVFAAVAILAASAWAPAAPAHSALAKMPVKEVTVFKDGHAFVLHEGRMPTDNAGNVVMDYLPTPVLGTFWPYSADKKVKLTSVVAGQRRVSVERTALQLRELIEANVGQEVLVTEKPAGRETVPQRYPGTIVGVPARSGEELEATSPPNTGERLPQKGNIVLIRTGQGVKAVPLDQIQDVTFLVNPRAKLAQEEFRNLLTLKLNWGGAKPAGKADVGMLYLQKGIRWIPHYKMDIDGDGNAVIKLQATLLNELTDLDDATCHLVVGVPTFAFEDMVDPISLQDRLASLSEHFRRDARTAYALSNAMMSQSAIARAVPSAPAGPDLGPQVGEAGRNEDLFVFTVDHVTLAKGQRMVLPVAEFKLTYKDVYVLDLPYAPPPEVRTNLNSSRQAELAKLYAAPKVIHNIRMTNTSKYPLTTAPALILRDGRVLAQGMITYTPIGGQTDLPVTAAVDVNVELTDKESKRTPNAVTWDGHQYMRVDLAGQVKLTNHRDHPIDLEVTRHLLGNVGEADHDGKAEMVNVFDQTVPHWWNWYSWPYWWNHFNSVGEIKWKLTLNAKKGVELNYTWHYFWRR